MDSIKPEIDKLWDLYAEKARIKSPHDNEFNKTITEFEKKAEKTVVKKLNPWLQILEEGVQWLANLNATLDIALKENKDDKSLRVPWALVGAACTQSVAIRRLVLSGLDSPARSILRSLDEHFMVCIVTLAERELRNGFFKPDSPEEARVFWHKELTSKKIESRIIEIEKTIGFDEETIEEFNEFRKQEKAINSLAVHPSYATSALTAMPICLDELDYNKPGILGCASELSIRTMDYACKSIWYFSMVGFLLLFEPYLNKPPLFRLNPKDEMSQVVVIGREIISKLVIKYWEYDSI
jgi:uncharacterized coiled-coil protein SlyX